MHFIKESDWRPSGIADLEPNAWTALRHDGNTCVVAGPGAGKTEFLAQRATYLLQTGKCPAPLRILAISFKKDAAENLADRVRQRCEAEQAQRFDSMTFDAFTKGLVDRFRTIIPESWRPTKRPDIIFPNRRDYENFLTRSRLSAPPEWQDEIASINPSTFEKNLVSKMSLPLTALEPNNEKDWLVKQWWSERLGKRPNSQLTFVMINRLSELLLRSNRQILRALRITYPFVFLDEFQDTTSAQYNFLHTVFYDTNAVLTAVGDDKQRIMGWAGALPDAFEQFISEFGASRIPLTFNYRSSPGLVQIQYIVAQVLDENVYAVESQTEEAIDEACAEIWKFRSVAAEAEQIGSWIAGDIENRNLTPRDYAILVRQTADRFETQLGQALSANGLCLRNESRKVGRTTLQDLLAEELTSLSIAILRIAVEQQSPKNWELTINALEKIRGLDPDDEIAGNRVHDEFSAFITELRKCTESTEPSAESSLVILDKIFCFLNLAELRQAYANYATGDNLEIAQEALQEYLSKCSETSETWLDCLDTFEGIAHIPLMTIHKSKGLEYDTVIFMGLDDNLWWSHTPGDYEGTATFFVGLSRAKQKVVFTYCEERGQPDGVRDLYEHLANAGVQEKSFP
jgi:superfamily I DNA/RNA helicase